MTAIECAAESRKLPGEGWWAVFVRRVAVGDVTGLKEYFAQTSVTKTSECGGGDEEVRVPVFIDVHGRTLVPLIPSGACDKSLDKAEVAGGRHLRWHVVWVRRIRKLPSAPSP